MVANYENGQQCAAVSSIQQWNCPILKALFYSEEKENLIIDRRQYCSSVQSSPIGNLITALLRAAIN